MTVGQAALLGLIQGVTEFLPISSSGHLVLAQHFFGLNESVLTFDVFIHVATLLAIIFFFGKSLFKVTFKEWFLIGVGTIPVVIVGLFFKDQVEALFERDSLLGLELIATGLINFFIDWKLQQAPVVAEGKSEAEVPSFATLSPIKSFIIGVTQAIAIIPGISRSGSTVAGAISLGLDREAAFRFSFLLAIPALLGAGILELKSVLEAGSVSIDPVTYGVGGLTALVSGLASLFIFKYVMTKARLQWFGWYCIALGIFVQFFLN